MKTYEITEISENLEIGKFYSLLGLINSRPTFSNISQGLTLQKFSMIDIDRVSIIIEVWNSARDSEISFADDWKVLQLAYIRDAKFRGCVKLKEGELTYMFNISAKSQSDRLIWLSSPSPTFWEEPLLPHSFLTKIITAEEIAEIEKEVIYLKV
jgi:hypothetical protein